MVFLVYIFLKRKMLVSSRQSFVVYFGMVQLFRRIVLIFGLILSLDLLTSVRLLVKMGSFPMNEWVVNFFTNIKLMSGVLFFTLNKFLPLIFFHEFLSLNLMFCFLIILLNWIIRVVKIMVSQNFLEVVA